MANPAKRKVGDSAAEGSEGSGTEGGGEATASTKGATTAAGKGAASGVSKRVTPPKSKAGEGAPSRYTAPNPRAHKGPSPRWVPVLMFTLWGLGLLLIILNYMELLPGSSPDGNGWYLVGGLASILGGIMVATQYR